MPKPKEMSAEVEDFERDKGWLETEITFGEQVALLHSEVSEALEAWRVTGSRTLRRLPTSWENYYGVLPKA